MTCIHTLYTYLTLLPSHRALTPSPSQVVDDLAELVRGLGETPQALSSDGSLPTSRPASLFRLLFRRNPILAAGKASVAASVEGETSCGRSRRRSSVISALLSGRSRARPSPILDDESVEGVDREFSLSGFFGIAREKSASHEETVNPVLLQKAKPRHQAGALARLQGHRPDHVAPSSSAEVNVYLSRCEGVELGRAASPTGSKPGTAAYKAARKEKLELFNRREKREAASETVAHQKQSRLQAIRTARSSLGMPSSSSALDTADARGRRPDCTARGNAEIIDRGRAKRLPGVQAVSFVSHAI